MDLKNVHSNLQTLLQRSPSSHLPTLPVLSPTDINTLRRMHQMIQKVPVFSKLSNRFSTQRQRQVHSTNKAVSNNRPAQIIVDDFRLYLTAFRAKVARLLDQFQALHSDPALASFDPASFAQTAVSHLVPVVQTFCLIRNTQFHHIGFASCATPAFKPDQLFAIFDSQLGDVSEEFTCKRADPSLRKFLSKHVTLDHTLEFSSVLLQIRQSQRMVESTVIFFLGFQKCHSDTVQRILANPKLSSLVRRYFETVFGVLQNSAEGKLTSPKLHSKCDRLANLLALNAIQIMQVCLAEAAGSPFDFVPRDLHLQAKLQQGQSRLTLSPHSFDFDLSFRRFDKAMFGLPERERLGHQVDQVLIEFKMALEGHFIRSLKERIHGRSKVLFELDAELRVTNVEVDVSASEPLGVSLNDYERGVPLSQMIADPMILELVSQKFDEQMERIDAPAFQPFLYGQFKLTVGFLTLIEGHLAREGPRFFLMIGKAPKDEQRICFNFSDGEADCPDETRDPDPEGEGAAGQKGRSGCESN